MSSCANTIAEPSDQIKVCEYDMVKTLAATPSGIVPFMVSTVRHSSSHGPLAQKLPVLILFRGMIRL